METEMAQLQAGSTLTHHPVPSISAPQSASSSLSLGARAMHASASTSTSPSSSSRRPATGTDPGKLYRERQATGGVRAPYQNWLCIPELAVLMRFFH